MCTVSMIGDHFRDKWVDRPNFAPITNIPGIGAQVMQYVPRHEFEALKREVEDMKALLKRAKIYDEKNGEPDCEIDEKMDLLRKVARLVGISLDDVIKPAAP